MQIFLDDKCFISYFAEPANKLSSLESMIDVMEYVIDAAPLNLFIPEDFYSLEIEGSTVSDIIYANFADPTIRDLVARIEFIIRVAEQVPNNIENGPTSAAGLREAGRGGLISNEDCEDLDWWQKGRMYKITDQTNARSAIRDFFVAEKLSAADFSNYSNIMFESLYFHCPTDHIKNIGVKFAQFSSTIIKHFSYLNDFAILDFEESKDDRELSSRAGNKGVTMTPESNATRNNRNAMQQREVAILKVLISCEWHTKITPRRGRIHFYPWANKHKEFNKVIGNRVIIGIMCKHLD